MAGISNELIYLDHNATTPAFPEVIEAMRACWSEPYLNPASQHEFGRRARRALEDTRERIAELLGAKTTGPRRDRVIFTSGGTESNNLAIRGILEQWGASSMNFDSARRLIASAIEHPSVATLANQLSSTGYEVDYLPVDSSGLIQASNLTTLLRPETRLVVAMLANNETGVVQPVAELAEICRSKNVPVHTDAVQAAGKLSVNFRELNVATMTIAAHKFGGPVGIGGLVVRDDIELSPLLRGGVQQAGLRPGTESVALAVGMLTALEEWHKNRPEWLTKMQSLRDEFEASIYSQIPEIKILGKDASRLPNTSNIAFIGLDRQALFLALDQAGVACSTGSACASGCSEPSAVHIAMGCEPAVISSALRFSFGVQSTAADVAESVNRICRVCNNLRRQKLR